MDIFSSHSTKIMSIRRHLRYFDNVSCKSNGTNVNPYCFLIERDDERNFLPENREFFPFSSCI
jgi:hypothetical protein